jgi:hypothetical protein
LAMLSTISLSSIRPQYESPHTKDLSAHTQLSFALL